MGMWSVEAWGPGEKNNTGTSGETEDEKESGVTDILSGSRAWLGHNQVVPIEKDGVERFCWDRNIKIKINF